MSKLTMRQIVNETIRDGERMLRDMKEATDLSDEPQTEAKASPEPETQLTLQDLREQILEAWYKEFPKRLNSDYMPEDLLQDITALFTQALTSLKTEMEKKKKDEELTGMGRYYRGKAEAHNMAISECQRLLEGLK